MPDPEIVRRARGNFDALVTLDRGFEFEHDLKTLTFGIVIVHVTKNRIEYYRPLFTALKAAVEAVGPGEVIHVRAQNHAWRLA
jgi:hypothetical protein